MYPFGKNPLRTLVAQQDESDCGVACLASLLRFYKSTASLERLRELSGTTVSGTTLAGLREAARKLGFDAEGHKADSLANLKEAVGAPVILHTTIREEHPMHQLEHYVVCYGWDPGRQCFLIGDPARGGSTYTEAALAAVWPSRVLLTLKPNASFQTQASASRLKRQWLLQMLRADVPLLLLATGLGVITAALSLSTAIFSQKLIDKILPAHDMRRLWTGLGLLFVLLVARAALTFLRTGLLNQQNQSFNNRLIQDFFGKLLYLPKSFFNNRKTGELVTRLNDTARIQRTVTYLSGAFAINLLFVLTGLIYIFLLSAQVGLLVASSIPVYCGLTWFFTRPLMSGYQRVMAAAAANESQYIDTIRNIDSVKASGREAFFQQVTQATYGQLQTQSYRLNQTSLRFGTVTDLTGTLLISGILSLTAYSVVVGSLKLGEMVALLAMVGSIIPAVNSLALATIQWQEASIAFDRMFEYTLLQPEAPAQPGAPPLVIESLLLEQVDFRYPGHSLLLKGVSMEVGKGEMVAITGESGSGKSTLLHLLQRFHAPTSGAITVNGQDWLAQPTAAWRRGLGVVSQRTTLFSGTIFENVCLGATTQEAEPFIAFCRTWGFDTYFERFPQSYATRIGESGISLSGGEQQLVLLARALFTSPQLLLLDEPTAAMDEHTEQFALRVLQKAQEMTAVIVITHRPALTAGATRVYHMQRGTLRQLETIAPDFVLS